MGRREVQARRPIRIVGVLVLKKEDSKCQIYTFGEVGLSQVLCADWPLTRLVVQLIGAGGEVVENKGVQYRGAVVCLVLPK